MCVWRMYFHWKRSRLEKESLIKLLRLIQLSDLLFDDREIQQQLIIICGKFTKFVGLPFFLIKNGEKKYHINFYFYFFDKILLSTCSVNFIEYSTYSFFKFKYIFSFYNIMLISLSIVRIFFYLNIFLVSINE